MAFSFWLHQEELKTAQAAPAPAPKDPQAAPPVAAAPPKPEAVPKSILRAPKVSFKEPVIAKEPANPHTASKTSKNVGTAPPAMNIVVGGNVF